MEVLLILILIYFAIKIIKQKSTPSKPTVTTRSAPAPEQPEEASLPIKGAYQKKWLLTYNEKSAYKTLKQICDKNNLHLMTKVRLLDLVEPIRENPKYKTYFYKIQAKHIDFVICDEKLVARCMIELDDNSHTKEPRITRDQFVNEVLESVGYKILHIKAVTEDLEQEILKTIPSSEG